MGIFDSVGEKLGKIDKAISKVNHFEKKVSHLLNDPIGALTGSSKLGSLSSGELAKVIARPDPLYSFSWDITMPSITASKSYNLGSEYVESCSIVLPEFGTRQVRQFGRYNTYPEATVSTNTVSIQFYADVHNTAFSYLHAWRTLVHPQAGVFGTPKAPKDAGTISGYKQDIVLFTRDSYNEIVWSLTYVNAWPTSIESTTDFNSNNERISFVAHFAIDDVIVSGYNIDTITNTVKSTITGTIKGIANSVVDSVKDIGKSAFKSTLTRLGKTAAAGFVSGAIFGGEESEE